MSKCRDDEDYKVYLQDRRTPCQFGLRCYQKNPVHLNKYKHPPKDNQKNKKEEPTEVVTGQKRKAEDESVVPEKKSDSLEVKHQDKKQNQNEIEDSDAKGENEKSPSAAKESPEKKDRLSLSPDKENAAEEEKANCSPKTPNKEQEKDSKNAPSSPVVENNLIFELFLTEMPRDFYKLYEFCSEISKDDPTVALKIVDLKLVGPFDVLTEKCTEIEEKEKYLKHWRYYYDVPEFQTVLKGNDKDGLHFGYWRDDPEKMPVFVAKNNANVSYKMFRVAENLFGALDAYFEERTKLANPFEKAPVVRLHQKLKSFAKDRNITLEKYTSGMKERENKVVARTFHGAGIVVPFDRKTQVGYRKLSATDSELQKLLKQIKEAESDEERSSLIATLQDIIRWATIAGDECDFGTCLELGHDLFTSGVTQVQELALQVLSIAYKQLNRSAFLKILEVHLKDRKEGTCLSVI